MLLLITILHSSRSLNTSTSLDKYIERECVREHNKFSIDKFENNLRNNNSSQSLCPLTRATCRGVGVKTASFTPTSEFPFHISVTICIHSALKCEQTSSVATEGFLPPNS